MSVSRKCIIRIFYPISRLDVLPPVNSEACNCQRLNTADPLYPPEKIRNIGVNTGIKWLSASVSPGYNSVEDAIRRKGSARIAFTRILAALHVTRADHSIGDTADVCVYTSTRFSAHDRKRHSP